MALTVIVIDSSRDCGTLSFSDWGKHRVAQELETLLSSSATGSHTGVSLQVGAASVYATGTLTLSTASGAVGGTIGGTLVTATAAGGDTASAALIAAAINADATVNKYASATSVGAVVTVKAAIPGTIGNGITLVASGTGVTASGAKLGAGTGVAGVGNPPTNSFTC
jgi:phage tail sheath gpL-like